MKRNYSGVWKGFAIVFAAVIYSILLFAFKKNFNLASWIAYGYTMVAFLVLLQASVSRAGQKRHTQCLIWRPQGFRVFIFVYSLFLAGLQQWQYLIYRRKQQGWWDCFC